MTMLALALNPYLRDWADVLLRWLHVIAAIGWIGSSFYFVLLDQSLRKPKEAEDVEAGVRGELWEVHGGGFYHVQKYQVAPRELPDHLEWFKWEAYATWLSGFALLVVLFWFDARTYMIDPTVADIGPWTAVGISAGLLLVAWIVYDVLCRTLGNRPVLLVLGIVAGTALAAWGTGELFSARAAWLQTGAMLGTVMAANVFFMIIPGQWELVRAKQAGRDPDPMPGIKAKQRSVHNNYFTLPVLITMLAGHFSFLTGHGNSWLILVFLMLVGAWIRHFYNLRHSGKTYWWMPAAAAVAMAALIGVMWPSGGSDATAATGGNAKKGSAVFASQACGGCHTLADARATGTEGPNLNLLKPNADLVARTVTNGRGEMPPFSGKLSKAQINDVAAYVSASAGSPSE